MENPIDPQRISQQVCDRIWGMVIGHALGDARGLPFEYNIGKPRETGRLDQVVTLIAHGHKLVKPPGSISDDTEMTLALWNSLITNQGMYNSQLATIGYIDWVNASAWDIGHNTKALFGKIKAVNPTQRMATYRKRLQKLTLDKPEDQRSMSNGSLMRATPLAVLNDWESVKLDAEISNPTSVNVQCSYVYVMALRMALRGKSKPEIWQTAYSQASQHPRLKEVFDSIITNQIRDVRGTRGFVLHALWCCFYGFMNFDNYTELIRWIITFQPGSDTDTNAAIAGGLFGAFYGYNNLYSLEAGNIDILMNVDRPDRPRIYTTKRYPEILPWVCEFYSPQIVADIIANK